MKLRFFGGAQEIGRSAIMLEGSTRIMMDYGIGINKKIEYPVSMPDIDAVILSHAHLDHSGAVPLLFNEMSVPVFGTLPTVSISEILIKDSIKIAARKGWAERIHNRELNSFLRHFVGCTYLEKRRVGDYDLTMYDAGHICGSAISMIECLDKGSKKRVVYTGDMKLLPQELHNGAEVVDGDVLIIESTYADRTHPDRETVKKDFITKIREVIENGGTALVPSFAVGRAQEIMAMLERNGLSDITWLDGMAKEITKIMLDSYGFVDNIEVLRKASESVSWISNKTDREVALRKPSIIVTTAGMLNGGPVLYYIERLRKNSHLFLTGYQVEGTNGRALMGEDRITINGRPRDLKTQFSYYDFSAHAGADELHDYIRRSGAHTVVCVHGSKENARHLAEYATAQGCRAFAPGVGESIDV